MFAISPKGISAIDPRPEGVDCYVDHLAGQKTSTKPSHPFYGRLPLTEIRDPTCEELETVLSKQCGDTNEANKPNMGVFCGLGTTWSREYEKCVRTPDEYITIDGTGKPYGDPPYPSIRPEGYKSPFDEPNNAYVYVPKSESVAGFRSLRAGRDCRKCNADRCRFPLTSEEGRKQAVLYVRLFRTIYEYGGWERTKRNLRYMIRQLIDDHNIYFNVGIHNDGLFLPWHRWYILEMETILMQGQDEYQTATDCSNTFVGIPYFDWHNLKNGESLNEFINNAHDDMGHHFGDSLGQSRSQGGCYPLQGALAGFRLTTDELLVRCWDRCRTCYVEDDPNLALHSLYPEPSQYNQFRNILEFGTGLHGAVHNIIGGTMNTGRASNDPIFFCHHGNIDKIWNDWQKQSAQHQEEFHGRDRRNFWAKWSLMPGSSSSPNQVLDLNRQQYLPPGENSRIFISAEYVDMDTSSMWGRGHTSSINR